MAKATSLPCEEQSPNHEKRDDLNEVNLLSSKLGDETVVFSNEDSTLGALFCEFSGVLDRFPKANSTIENKNIPSMG